MEVPLYGEKISNCISHWNFWGFESMGSIVFTVLNGFLTRITAKSASERETCVGYDDIAGYDGAASGSYRIG